MNQQDIDLIKILEFKESPVTPDKIICIKLKLNNDIFTGLLIKEKNNEES